ncbi:MULTISPECIES: ATP-binding protein [unclassified Roseovarius]|uniref:ATP-binding protein n=1 Tax=unclassified Roseovarius TaxID=2614913 RepID=UPI00273F373E|nr:ATP-binding protein [Roseovarius sp. MMSF_3350]
MAATAPSAPDPLVARSAPATERAVRAMVQALAAALAGAGIGADQRGSITLAVGEALNNVTEHAYAGRRPGQVHMIADLLPDRVLVTLSDSGRAMPGNRLPAGDLPDSSGPRADLPEGGFGWHLIHKLCPELTYSRQAGTNTLCMTFPRHADAEKT